MSGTILITTEWFNDAPNFEEMRAKLEGAGLALRVSGHRGILSAEQLKPLLDGARGCIAGIDHFTRDVIESASALEVISRTGVGFERIDIDACTERGVVVTTSVASNSDAVAEFALGLILAVARDIGRGFVSMRGGKWRSGDLLGSTVVGKRLGIVGMGSIGSRLARLARGLRMEVLYYDVVRKPGLETSGEVTYAPLDELLARSDFVSLHAPVTSDSRRLIGERELRRMQPHAFLVNTARGPLIDEAALVSAIDEGWIRGAAIDVYDPEPPSPENPLLHRERILVTPHIAGSSEDARRKNLALAVENLLAVLGGERPPTVMNPRVFELSGR